MSDEFNMSDDRRRNQANPKDKATRKISFKKDDNSGIAASVPKRKDSKIIGVLEDQEITDEELMSKEFFDRSAQLKASLDLLAAQNQANVKTKPSAPIPPNMTKNQEIPLN